MMSSTTLLSFAIALCSTVVGAHAGQPSEPFTYFDNIGVQFFEEYDDLEASGVDIAPDGSHLVIVTDEGEIVFLNLLDYESGHCLLDLSDDIEGTDLEGVAIDPSSWRSDDMNVYIVHEGGDDDEPYLYKISYEYDPDEGSCSASVVDSKSLYGAIPCLETSNGIESLGLKSAFTATQPAVFLVGVQDTGMVYEVTSEGKSNGPHCYGGSMGADDISATAYNEENGHIWSYIESEDTITVFDADQGCPVATYQVPNADDEDQEGLAIDWAGNKMYLITDGQGDGSTVQVYNFTYPSDIAECIDSEFDVEPCSFTVCGGGDTRSGYLRPNLFDRLRI